MTAAEMKMIHDREYYSMRAAVAERAENQISQIRTVIAIHKQNHSDTMVMTHDQKKKAEEQCAWKALDNIEKEIEAIIGQEG
ncbi:hypothetical protein [Lacrimispora sp.]|uniref:hypothetical protein n=1 Tax=Lacrimispora sp. TaxID=2719234 RepID=UPI0028B16DE1|nr:hypothetical protein [Lacrimispora sp.]